VPSFDTGVEISLHALRDRGSTVVERLGKGHAGRLLEQVAAEQVQRSRCAISLLVGGGVRVSAQRAALGAQGATISAVAASVVTSVTAAIAAIVSSAITRAGSAVVVVIIALAGREHQRGSKPEGGKPRDPQPDWYERSCGVLHEFLRRRAYQSSGLGRRRRLSVPI